VKDNTAEEAHTCKHELLYLPYLLSTSSLSGHLLLYRLLPLQHHVDSRRSHLPYAGHSGVEHVGKERGSRIDMDVDMHVTIPTTTTSADNKVYKIVRVVSNTAYITTVMCANVCIDVLAHLRSLMKVGGWTGTCSDKFLRDGSRVVAPRAATGGMTYLYTLHVSGTASLSQSRDDLQ